MPMDVGKLKNLQVLSSFYVDKGSEANIQQLGELNLHGTLSISELQNIVNPSDAHAANLKHKSHLRKLELEWNATTDNSEKEREVLEKLQPSKYLKELSIRNYGGTRFPYWFGDDSLSNVVSLKLSNCEYCVLLPPLGILPSLKKLSITRLSGIVVIGSEFYGNGNNSSSGIVPFASLQTLIFASMKGWEEWDCKIVTGAFPCLQELSIKNCPNLKGCLPKQLPCLVKLEITYCELLVASVSLAPAIHELHLINCGKLQFDYQPSTLRILMIGGCLMEGSLLEWAGHTLTHISVESLVIESCPNMNIPLDFRYNFLLSLDITSSSHSLRTFPLDFFPKLQRLNFTKCRNLEMLSHDHKHDHRLKALSITKCLKFVSFPECMHTLFPSLSELTIINCPQLKSFSDGGLPPSLKRLHLARCSELLIASLKRALGINTSLKSLYIENVNVESFPDQGLLPLSLTTLCINNCVNLKKLNYKGLFHLSSLDNFYIMDCPNLQCLPVEGMHRSISTIEIENCSLLEKQCKKPKCDVWGKIYHFESKIIDDKYRPIFIQCSSFVRNEELV